MARKIFLDGNADERPSLPFAIFLCLIPITTFFYMKRRQRNRYNEVAAPSNNTRNAAQGRSGKAETPEEKEKREKDENKWKGTIAAETKKLEEEKKKRSEAEAIAAQLQRQLREAQANLLHGRFQLDKALHPNDPVLNDTTPIEVYDTVRPLSRDSPAPEKKATRPVKDGRYVNKPVKKGKGVEFVQVQPLDGINKHPVTKLATSQKDTADGPGHAGIAIHDGTKFTPYNDPSRKENRWDLTMDGSEDKGRRFTNERYKGPDQLRLKTEELKAHVPEATFAIFQKAAGMACAQQGSSEYSEAMIDSRHDEFGVYPRFSTDPMDAITHLLSDKDPEIILQGMLQGKKKISRSKSNKDPNDFMARYCMNGYPPDKESLVIAWYFDSFRIVLSLIRMNVIRGEPYHLEKRLGFKFLLLEWLEIFGIQCAIQRLMSPVGFDLTGLCIRLHCVPWDKPVNSLKLSVTIFLPGGANKVDKNGKERENWETRMTAARKSWREVWGFLSMQTQASGRESGWKAFAQRELVFCPGFTFEGIKQAGGLPTEASPNTEPNNRHDPILNALTSGGYPYPGRSAMIDHGHRLTPFIRPTAVIFNRRRQYTWAAPSLTKTSHDFADGMVALCLEMIDPRHWLLGAAKGYPDDVADDNLGVRLQNDDVSIIKFNSTIPMKMGKDNKPIGFPDLRFHPKLEALHMAYVPLARHTDGTAAAEAPMPATATLVLSSDFGLKALLQDKTGIEQDYPDPPRPRNMILYVDIRSGDVQKLADELYEMLVGLAKKQHGAGWSGTNENIHKDAKENMDVLRQVSYQLEDDSKAPISGKITQIRW